MHPALTTISTAVERLRRIESILHDYGISMDAGERSDPKALVDVDLGFGQTIRVGPFLLELSLLY